MATLRCPNCGSEVLLPEKSSLSVGMTLSEESKGDYVLPMRDSKGRFTKTTTENKENTTMNNTMNFDMETLAKMVAVAAAQLRDMNVDQNATNTVKEEKLTVNYPTVSDGGQWAKGSKYYGKEICGYVFNPYMIRWHLQRQFEELMNKAKFDNYNVYNRIQRDYPYMYSVKYTLEEVRKLAMLRKKDRIAYDERCRLFTNEHCKRIFRDYINEVINVISREERRLVNENRVGKHVFTYIKKYGYMEIGTVSEKIENHRVVKYLERTKEFESVYVDLNRILEAINRSWSYDDLYKLMRDNIEIKVPAATRKSKAFMDAFIKSGAYYTLKQKLMFDDTFSFRDMKGRAAIMELRRELNNTRNEGYMIYAMLKKAMGIR